MDAETDGLRVINDGTVGDGGGFVANQVPGRPDLGFGIDVSVGAELSAKQPEDETAPSVKWARRGTKEQGIGKAPDKTAEAVGEREGGL